jgi:tight adherence protein B
MSEPSEVIATLSALYTAGVSLSTAWSEVAALEGAGDVPATICEAMSAGESPHDAIARITQGADESWRAVGACWAIARECGAPVAPALGALAEALRDSSRTERQISAAVAGPRATMRLVMVLPIVGALGGALGGFDTLGFLVTTAAGGGLLVAGALMMAGAWWWLRLAVARASPPPGALSLELDLFAVATQGAALPERASILVSENLTRYSLLSPERSVVPSLISLSRRAGVPVSALARSAASVHRDTVRTDAENRVQRLGVAVVLPLGLLVLPAFVMVAIVPLAVSLWSGALA